MGEAGGFKEVDGEVQGGAVEGMNLQSFSRFYNRLMIRHNFLDHLFLKEW